jgi:hypothetical protein
MYRNGRSTLVAASGFKNLPDFRPPFCPHVANNFREDSYAKMVPYEKTKDGNKQWYFKATHNCDFESMRACLTHLILTHKSNFLQ